MLTHEPTENYAIDDLLRELSDKPAPKKLGSVPAWNGEGGWIPKERLELVAR